MKLVHFYPGSFNGVTKEIDDVFNTIFDNPTRAKTERKADHDWQPRVDVRETEDAFLLVAELPGISKDDLTIEFEDDVLRISGERKSNTEDEKTNVLRSERIFGKFRRSFKVSTRVNADKIEAGYENGLLTITLPKAEEVKPKSIKIKAVK